MAEPFYTTVLRVLHVGGGWLAFGAAPIGLLALKGSRRHVLAGRCFLLSMTTGITEGLMLAVICAYLSSVTAQLLDHSRTPRLLAIASPCTRSDLSPLLPDQRLW